MKNFLGIVAVGASRTSAFTSYKLTAQGKSTSAFVGGDNVFISRASDGDLFNPMDGQENLTVQNDLLKRMKFVQEASFSSDSFKQKDLHYTVCVSGCQQHIVSDSRLAFCPCCSTSFSEDADDEEAEDDEAGDKSEDDAEEDDEAGDKSEDDEAEDDSDGEDDAESESGDKCEDDADCDDSDEAVDDEIAEAADALPDDEDDEDLDVDDAEDATDGSDTIVAVASSFAEARATFLESREFEGRSCSADERVHYTVCSSAQCGNHIISESHVGVCPTCLSEAVEPDADNQDDDMAAIDAELDDLDDQDVSEAADKSDDEDGDDDADKSEDEDGDDDADDESADKSEDGDDGKSESGKCRSEDNDGDEDDAGADTDGDAVEVSLEDNIPEDASSESLDVSAALVQGKHQWTAYYNGRPIAQASESADVDLFTKPAFGVAVIQASRNVGVRKALSAFGFKGISYTAIPEGAVKRVIRERVSQATAEISKRQKDFEKRFLDCLTTASQGFSRNFFVDENENPVANPVVEALASTLATAGVHNPRTLLDRALSSSRMDQYNSMLIAKALELLEQPEAVVQSLSKAIVGSARVPSTSSADAQPDLRSRLSSMGTPVSTETHTSQSSADSAANAGTSDVMRRALQSLGR